MQFCPKCGAILVQKTKNYGCPRCSYSTKDKVKITTSEKMGNKEEIAVVKKDVNIQPVVAEKCSKCGNGECYFWAIQTRASDEAETKFFKCTKCGHTHKQYR